MKLPMHRLEPLLIDMGVNLRRRNVGVPKHFLNDPQIGPVAEQMGGKTVPKQMRIDVRFQSGMSGPCFLRSARSAPSLVSFPGPTEKSRCRCGA